MKRPLGIGGGKVPKNNNIGQSLRRYSGSFEQAFGWSGGGRGSPCELSNDVEWSSDCLRTFEGRLAFGCGTFGSVGSKPRTDQIRTRNQPI